MREKKECMIYIDSLEYGANPETICRLRTRYCVEWYSKKAARYKNIFIVLSIINIAIPQVSTIVALNGHVSIISAILTSLVSFSTALLALLNVKERWTAYRAAAENIKRQYTLYCIQAPPYQGDEAHRRYLQMLEQGMAEENGRWIAQQQNNSRSSDA
ncbi:MAG: DUF4231 domain-containing protein [Butyrivibrio sp.]|nr:DUF4231 domain-containing protein [Acetatifactor muris]MCM1559854.1 DUF4231 domain-containing protein [Butyrivibrio sp.]